LRVWFSLDSLEQKVAANGCTLWSERLNLWVILRIKNWILRSTNIVRWSKQKIWTSCKAENILVCLVRLVLKASGSLLLINCGNGYFMEVSVRCIMQPCQFVFWLLFYCCCKFVAMRMFININDDFDFNVRFTPTQLVVNLFSSFVLC